MAMLSHRSQNPLWSQMTLTEKQKCLNICAQNLVQPVRMATGIEEGW